MFWHQNVRESVLSRNLLYDTLSPLSILRNPRWRPRWPPKNKMEFITFIFLKFRSFVHVDHVNCITVFFAASFATSSSSSLHRTW